MEQTELSFEDQVKQYEAACGALTDAYPWGFDAFYRGHSSGGYLEECLELNQDGTFGTFYTIGDKADYKWFQWKAEGKFFYNSKERKLTLVADKLEFVHSSNWQEDKLNAVILECVEKTFKKVEIPNFFWGIKEFYFPWYTIKKIGDDYDFLTPELSYFNYTPHYNCLSLKAKIQMMEDFSKLSTSGQRFINEPVKFEGGQRATITLTLNPNKTLELNEVNSSYDRDGPYNWHSRFSCLGTWEYSDSREITLKFHSFQATNDGKEYPEAEINNFNLHTEAKTQNFFFEASNSIRIVSAHWHYSEFRGASVYELLK